MTTIPASAIVQVNPAVLSAGGRALDIIGVILTTNSRVPIGAVQPFSNQVDVSNYFGPSSTEEALSMIYFNGFDNSNIKPARVYFAQYPTASVAGYLRGGPIDTLTIAQLNALTVGALTVTVNGSGYTAAAVSFGTVGSFSAAANVIQAGFGSGALPFTTSYDSIAGAFVITTTATGSGATISYAATNNLATAIMLTAASGAVTSQGAVAATPGPFMTALTQATQDWATFMTAFDPDVSGNTNKLAFATWNSLQNDRYGYVCWDSDATPKTVVPATSSLGYLLTLNEYSGTCLISATDATLAAFICGSAASIDFSEHNGRVTFAFRSQAGLSAPVTDQTTGDNLIANGYNFYGAYATANQGFIFFYPGSVSGPFQWFDSYIDQIWLNNQFQLALMELLVNAKSIPYNAAGYSLIEAACLDPINQGFNFGAFRAGVTLSMAQAAEVNNAAGVTISNTLNQRGWYLQVLDASPQVRQARGSPPCTFWYLDGQSVQKISLASIELM
jgi:hypothetical protein